MKGFPITNSPEDTVDNSDNKNDWLYHSEAVYDNNWLFLEVKLNWLLQMARRWVSSNKVSISVVRGGGGCELENETSVKNLNIHEKM